MLGPSVCIALRVLLIFEPYSFTPLMLSATSSPHKTNYKEKKYKTIDTQPIQLQQNVNNSQLTKILPRNPRHRRLFICPQLCRALLTGSSRGGELPPRRLSERHEKPDRQLCRRTTRRLLLRQLREVQRQRQELDEDCRHKVYKNLPQLGPT